MHPSSILAGIVLTFGAIALANLYLPAAANSPQLIIVPAVTDDTTFQAVDPFETSPELGSDSAELETAGPISAEPATEPGAQAAPVPEAQVADTARKRNVAQADEVTPQRSEPKTQSSGSSREPAPRESSRPATSQAVAQAQESAPRAVTPREEMPGKAPSTSTGTSEQGSSGEAERPKSEPERAPSRRESPRQPGNQTRFASSSAEDAPAQAPVNPGVSVSAIAGNRAWVRIGDTRTLVVSIGDSIPELGRVMQISGDEVTFENGLTLKVAL